MEEQIQKTIELQNEAAVLMNTRPAASSKEERDERLRGLFQVKLEAYQARPVAACTAFEQDTEICVKREERVAAEKLRLGRQVLVDQGDDGKPGLGADK